MVVPELVLFVLNGFFGAFIHTIMWAKSARDVVTWDGVKALIAGPIAGYVYYQAHTGHGFPDGVIAFVVGYVGKDFFDWLVAKLYPGKKAGKG